MTFSKCKILSDGLTIIDDLGVAGVAEGTDGKEWWSVGLEGVVVVVAVVALPIEEAE